MFTQNERQKYVSPVNTHEPNSSAPQNFTDLLLAAPNRYNRKRKKEKQIHVNGYLPPSEESTALSIRKPRRNSENTPYKNTLSEISTLDEKALKNLGWTKVLRSHCGLNQFWYFPPHSSPFISESVENLQCFSSLDGGEMQKHLSSNPVLLQGDFNIVWEAMRKEGWDKVRIEERHDSEDEVKYFYEYFYSPILSQCRDWGIQRFCSQEAVLNYIARSVIYMYIYIYLI
ncbi:hypothetical protein EON64_02100 [archaeon]|nr:MAG: hypothetical protein EON64_02100 [archaeon]